MKWIVKNKRKSKVRYSYRDSTCNGARLRFGLPICSLTAPSCPDPKTFNGTQSAQATELGWKAEEQDDGCEELKEFTMLYIDVTQPAARGGMVVGGYVPVISEHDRHSLLCLATASFESPTTLSSRYERIILDWVIWY